MVCTDIKTLLQNVGLHTYDVDMNSYSKYVF